MRYILFVFLILSFAVGVLFCTTPLFAEEDEMLKDLESSEFVHEKTQGPGVKGQSSDFVQYMNKDGKEEDDAIELIRIDDDSRVAFDTKEDASVALQMNY